METIIYKWTRDRYEREERGARWHYNEEDSEVIYLPAERAERLSSDEEMAFFESLGADVDVTRHRDGSVTIYNVRPDGCARTIECFDPVDIADAIERAGYRELEAMKATEGANWIAYEEHQGGDYIVLTFGSGENTAKLELNNLQWVG